MEQALIVSDSEKSIEFFQEMLENCSCKEIAVAATGAEARTRKNENRPDICIINAPIAGESGEELASALAADNDCQVILVVKAQRVDRALAAVERLGVAVVARPVNKNGFRSLLQMVRVAECRIWRLQTEKTKLLKKMEDTKVIDRAKMLLVSYLSMTEKDAHRYIEKQAMDMRLSKRKIAEGILKTYEY